jgi:hypothetical protein
MSDPFYVLPERIELDCEQYSEITRALDNAIKGFDAAPEADPLGETRQALDDALKLLSRRIWPDLDDL